MNQQKKAPRQIPIISQEQFDKIVEQDTESEICPFSKQLRDDNETFMECLSKAADTLTDEEKAMFRKF